MISNPDQLATAVSRELGVLAFGGALGVLLVRQPAKAVCTSPFPSPECLALQTFSTDLLFGFAVLAAILLVVSALLDEYVVDSSEN